MFDVEIGGRKGSIADVFPNWHAHDRFGLVIDSPLGGIGATHLLQIAITSFYDVKPSRRAERKIYPEIYALHSGKGNGTHAPFDFWPQRREKILPGDQRTVLDAINDCGITRLAVPDRLPQDIKHRPKEEDAALDRIVTAVAYSPSGRVGKPDFTITGNDKRTEHNPGRVLRPLIPREPALQASGMPVKEVDPTYRNWLLEREADVSEMERVAAEARRAAIRNEQGLVTESYRFISVIDALRRL
ncbi:hypothetical protein NKI54_35035 [Mesorhizobium sp. M0663]|uniref:hypothetical protein n=1 Tax=Mesorhizobium sp. M0663 TaxID=2956981 RepID=UPI0033370802